MARKSLTPALSTPTVQRGDCYRGHRTRCTACHEGVREGGLAGELADPKLVQVRKQGEIDDGEGNVSAEEKDGTLGALTAASPAAAGRSRWKNTPIWQTGSSSPVQLLPPPPL